MELQVAATSLSWCQPSGPPSSSSYSKTLASAFYTPSSRRRSVFRCDGALLCRYTEKSSLLFGGFKLSKLYRSQSSKRVKSHVPAIKSTVSASMDRFFDEEFEKRIDEFARMVDDDAVSLSSDGNSRDHLKHFDALETPEFHVRHEIVPANFEGGAGYADSPFSFGILRRKRLWEEGLMQAGETPYCSVKKAFSSMVFIIRELHSFTLQMRGILLYEDLQGILANVQKEIHASFVWLFQKVFCHTPTLMVSVMILLANYSVYSMSTTTAIASMPTVQQYTVTSEEVFAMEDHNMKPDLDSLNVKKSTFSSSLNDKTTSMGGNGAGGGKIKTIASSTDGDDMQEENLWKSVIDEASKMQVQSSDEHIDQDTMQQFVSPIYAKIESDGHTEYFRIEMQYQISLAEDPYNPLLLANYAQFLYLVARDFDRAEDYFKRATKIEPKDAEALNKYAKFLWLVRNDIWAAEETFLESIAAESENSFYAADYAHFLWSTGGTETCFPLDSPDAEP